MLKKLYELREELESEGRNKELEVIDMLINGIEDILIDIEDLKEALKYEDLDEMFRIIKNMVKKIEG